MLCLVLFLTHTTCPHMLHTYTHTHTHTHTHIHTHTYIHIQCTHTHTHIRICTYIYTHTHTHIHIHTHTCKHTQPALSHRSSLLFLHSYLDSSIRMSLQLLDLTSQHSTFPPRVAKASTLGYDKILCHAPHPSPPSPIGVLDMDCNGYFPLCYFVLHNLLWPPTWLVINTRSVFWCYLLVSIETAIANGQVVGMWYIGSTIYAVSIGY